jgi:hypothetical protein
MVKRETSNKATFPGISKAKFFTLNLEDVEVKSAKDSGFMALTPVSTLRAIFNFVVICYLRVG